MVIKWTAFITCMPHMSLLLHLTIKYVILPYYSVLQAYPMNIPLPIKWLINCVSIHHLICMFVESHTSLWPAVS